MKSKRSNNRGKILYISLSVGCAWVGLGDFFQSNLILLDWEIPNPTQPITCVKSENQHDSTYHMELLEKKKKSTLTNNMIFMILIII